MKKIQSHQINVNVPDCRLSSRDGWQAFVLAGVSGLLLLWSTPGARSVPWLAWVALVPLTAALRGKRPRQAALLGFLCGIVFYLPMLSWVLIVLGTYGQVPLAVTLPALILLAAYMSGYIALFACLTAKVADRQEWLSLWLPPFLWVSLDWIRGIFLTGFPWQDLAYSQYRNLGLIQVADLGGHHGVTFLIVLVNSLLALVLRWPKGTEDNHDRWRGALPAAAACVLLALSYGYGLWRFDQVGATAAQAPTLPVTVVQGNIEQSEKWRPEEANATLDSYVGLSRGMGPSDSLILWPETAIPFSVDDAAFLENLAAAVLPTDKACLLTGAPHDEQDPASGAERYYNRAILLEAGGVVAGHYDKIHLVPFGEYIPLRGLFPKLSPVVETMADFSPGQSLAPVACKGKKIGVLICFESIFPELSRTQVQGGAVMLANITNDAWFGRSGAPWQHLSMVVFRAVETKRALARAANTGFSCLIGPDGRLDGLSQLFVPYAYAATVPLMTEQTLFVRGGYLFAPLCCLVALGMILLASRQRTFAHK